MMKRQEFIEYLENQIELIQQLIDALKNNEEKDCIAIHRIDTTLLDEWLTGEEFDGD